MTTTIVVIVVCVIFSFLASAWVNAISRLTIARARRLENEQPKRGGLLVEIADNPRPYVTATLLVMLLARVTATVLVAALMIDLGIVWAEVVVIAAVTFVLFQLVELAPRSWILERPDQVMLFAARPVSVLGKVLRPVSLAMVKLNRVVLLVLPGRGTPTGPLTSEEEIKSIIDVAESEEVIETGEREMIHSIFEFGDTVVREVMVPRPDMVCVEASSSADGALEEMMKAGLSRVPVIEESIDNIVGILYIKDLVRRLRNDRGKKLKAADVARDAGFVPESKNVAELLPEMREAKTHMMIVVDEYGGVAGLVTLEDLLEEIVGEIADEYDQEEPSIEPVDDVTLRVDARLSIDELNDLLDAQLPHTEWDSVGGLVGGMLGRVANEGDEVSVDGIHFRVEKTKGRRIRKVLVRRGAGGPV